MELNRLDMMLLTKEECLRVSYSVREQLYVATINHAVVVEAHSLAMLWSKICTTYDIHHKKDFSEEQYTHAAKVLQEGFDFVYQVSKDDPRIWFAQMMDGDEQCSDPIWYVAAHEPWLMQIYLGWSFQISGDSSY